MLWSGHYPSRCFYQLSEGSRSHLHPYWRPQPSARQYRTLAIPQFFRRGGCVIMNTVLGTGGAGYIGSHVVQQLLARDERVVVIDNLSTGFREAVRGAELVVGNVGDMDLVGDVMANHHVDAVLHF